jgi:putative ABC transport system permease protein
VLSCAIGVALGFAAQAVIAEILGGILRADLPAPGALPAAQGFLVGLVLLLGFALPPLVQLKNVPAVRVIRRESGSAKGGTVAVYLAGLASLSGLLIWQAGDLSLGITVVGGFGVAVALFAVIAWLVSALCFRKFFCPENRVLDIALRYGLANLRRHARGNAIQVGEPGTWPHRSAAADLYAQRSRRCVAAQRAAGCANRFLLGVQPDQLAAVKAFFAEKENRRGPSSTPWCAPVLTGGERQEGVGRRLHRGARAAPGRSASSISPSLRSLRRTMCWWPGKMGSRRARRASVEEGIARRLGWKMGDELTFTIGNESFQRRISSERRLRWDSMKVNFLRHRPARAGRALSRRATSRRSASSPARKRR